MKTKLNLILLLLVVILLPLNAWLYSDLVYTKDVLALSDNKTPEIVYVPFEVAKAIEVEKPVYIDRIIEVPPEIVTVTIYEDRIVEKEVIKEIPLKYTPRPFESEAELKAWTDNWTPRAVSYSINGVNSFEGICEGFASAFMIDAVNAGYLVGTQIDPTRNHMIVIVPIYNENRYLFVEPETKIITKWFMGIEWGIN